MTDQELKNLVSSLVVSQKQMMDAIKEVAEQQKKTDEQLAKTDAQLAKTDIQLQNTDKKLARLSELVGNISNNQGDIAEEFFFQSFIKNPSLGCIKFDSVSRNLNNHIGKLQEEYDLVLINGDTLAVIEVKAKAHKNDLEKFVTRKLPNFQKLFAAYRNYRYYAGVATLVTNAELIKTADELGLFLLTQQGDRAEVVNNGRLMNHD